MPLAFPTIVPPFGIAAVIFLLATSDNADYKRNVLLVAVAVMVMNFFAMLLAKPIIKYAAFPLALFGAVLGVLQVALSISIVFFGLRLLGVLPAVPK
jgi:small neutral amino acid transporter SnatA (MarC family)